MKRTVLVGLLFALALTACATAKESQLSDQEREAIAQLAGQPLRVFLGRHFLNRTEPAEAIGFKTRFTYGNYRQLLRPKAIFVEFCGKSEGTLLRAPSHQRSWNDTSPESFSDPRRSGTAEMTLRGLCDASASNPGCGAARASKEGAFGTFECRAANGDKLLWAVTIDGSPGIVSGDTIRAAQMEISITAK